MRLVAVAVMMAQVLTEEEDVAMEAVEVTLALSALTLETTTTMTVTMEEVQVTVDSVFK